MTYYSLRLCSGRGAFEAIPRPRLKVNLAAVRQALEANGIPVIDARVMLIAKLAHEVTLSQDGRVLIKSPDGAVAEQLFSEFRAAASPHLGDGEVEREPAAGKT